MKKAFWMVLLLIFSLSVLTAQKAVLKGKITNLPSSASPFLAVEMWYMDNWRIIDTLPLSPAGYFEKKIAGANAQCRIRAWGQPKAWLEFILPKLEREDVLLDFGFINYRQLSGNVAYLDEKENAVYFFMISELRKTQIKRDSLQNVLKKIAPDDPEHEQKMTQLKQAQTAATQRTNRFFENIAGQNKGTLVGDVIAKIYQTILPEDYPQDSLSMLPDTRAFYRAHFLDKFPFRNEKLLYFNGGYKMLSDYQKYYFGTDSVENQLFIENVMRHRNGNEAVDLWLFQYLLERFIDLKQDAAITYLIKWYAPDCSSEDAQISDYLKNLVQALQKCVVGQPLYEVALPDLQGQNVSLKSIATAKKLTLFYLWRTNCGHCLEFKPTLAKLYEQYKSQGFEVVAICLDKEQAAWKTFLSENPSPWVDVWLNTDERATFYKNFPISGTPTLISADANFNTHSRTIVRTALERYLADFFGKI